METNQISSSISTSSPDRSAERIAARELVRNEIKRMKMRQLTKINITIEEKADKLAKEWMQELK